MENKYTPDFIKTEKEPVVFFLPIRDDEFTDYEIPRTDFKNNCATNITIRRGGGVKSNLKDFIRAKYLGADIYTNDETLLSLCNREKGTNKYNIFILYKGVWENIHRVFPDMKKDEDIVQLCYINLFKEE